MARIMVAAMPFTGHVAPMLAVARELTARGHAVRFYTGSAFLDRVEESGAALVPWEAAPTFDENDLSSTFPRMVGRRGLGQVMINLQDLFIGTAPAQATDLLAAWQRERWDLLVLEESAAGAALAAEKTSARWATVAILPLALPSRHAPPSGLGLLPGTTPTGRMRDAALRGIRPLLMRPLRKPLDRARTAVGLRPSRAGFDEGVFSPHLILASGSPSLDYGRPDGPPQLRYVGALNGHVASASPILPPWWDDLTGRRVIHVTQGTQNVDPSDLIRPALAALADTETLVVVATGVGGRSELPLAVPANARVAGLLPYSELLPKVDVVVTNGGWGGVLAALSHDIPLVIAGADLDKPEVAARVAWSGAGVNLRTGTPTPAQVRDAVERIAADNSFRDAAARVGGELRSLGGARRAAELLEDLI